MICNVIKGPSFEAAEKEICGAWQKGADLLEFRLDCFFSLNSDAIRRLKNLTPLASIFTLRSKNEGGYYAGSEEKRVEEIKRLAFLKPRYFDIEATLPQATIKNLMEAHPDINWIASHHDFSETPIDLEAIYKKINCHNTRFCKLALQAKNSLDTLRLLSFAKNKKDLIAVSMGNLGIPSRILGPVFNIPVCYTSSTPSSKLGQIDIHMLKKIYRLGKLGPNTKILGLIGDPVDKSIGHFTHNRFINKNDLNAVYVKFPVTKEELGLFLKYCLELPFLGLSVTMPLKEAILPYLNDIDPEAALIGAVNTLVFNNGKIYGFNTDGKGAVAALERKIDNFPKRIVLLGCGGAAKAIAYELKKRGHFLTILNRNVDKAKAFAKKIDACSGNFEEMELLYKEGYDVLIQATPCKSPISEKHIDPKAIVMDIKTYPKNTPFLAAALQKGCKVIFGYEMFLEQAKRQFDIWNNI